MKRRVIGNDKIKGILRVRRNEIDVRFGGSRIEVSSEMKEEESILGDGGMTRVRNETLEEAEGGVTCSGAQI